MTGREAPGTPWSVGAMSADDLARATGDWAAAGKAGPDCAACGAPWGHAHDQACPIRIAREISASRRQAPAPSWLAVAAAVCGFLAVALFLTWCGSL